MKFYGKIGFFRFGKRLEYEDYDVFFSDHITVEWRMVCGCHGSKFLSNMRHGERQFF